MVVVIVGCSSSLTLSVFESVASYEENMIDVMQSPCANPCSMAHPLPNRCPA